MRARPNDHDGTRAETRDGGPASETAGREVDPSARYTLDELVAAATAALTENPAQPRSGRITAMPDKRMVRWYRTEEIIDAPELVDGAARYTTRHLHQIVSVKRLQALGSSLADIKATTTGLNDAQLAVLADMTTSPQAVSAPAVRERFWAAPPALEDARAPAQELADAAAPRPPVAPSRVPDALLVDAAGDLRALDIREHPAGASRSLLAATAPAAPFAGASQLTGVALDGGLVLLVPSAGALTPADLETIRAAAAPLCTALANAGLVGPTSMED